MNEISEQQRPYGQHNTNHPASSTSPHAETKTANNMEENKPKRKYSKNGCKECKRRKMKCNEGKPSCWHCSRLNKECVYEPVRNKENKKDSTTTKRQNGGIDDKSGSTDHLSSSFKTESDEKLVGTTTTTATATGTATTTSAATPPAFRSQYNSPLALPNILNQQEVQNHHQMFQMPITPYLNYHALPAHAQAQQAPSAGSAKVESPASIGGSTASDSSAMALDPLMNSIPQYFQDEVFMNNANLMAQNLNDFLTQKLEEAISMDSGMQDYVENSQIPFLKDNHAMHGTANLSQDNLSVLNRTNNVIRKDQSHQPQQQQQYQQQQQHQQQQQSHQQKPKLISYNMRSLKSVPQVSPKAFNLDEPHQTYLELFYSDFAKVIIPFQPSETNNRVRDILLTLASKNAYLMSAVLACGARSAIKLKQDHQSHEKAYFRYLSNCLAALSKILNSAKRKLAENVEPLLLTILLLTSDNASSKNQAWRPHLRGAKDLLLMYAQQKKGSDPHPTSLVFSFCDLWYTTFEILAGTGGAPLGATFDSEQEMDLLINPDEDKSASLKELDLLLNNSFSLFAGYTISLTFVLRDLIKLLNKEKKSRTAPETLPSVHEAVQLLSRLEKESEFYIIDPSGLVPESHYMHPESHISAPLGVEHIPETAISTVTLPDGTKETFCWYDIAQQFNVKGAMLMIFRRILKLPKDSPYVQELVASILKLMYFLDTDDPPKLYHIMMIQAQLWEVGCCCIKQHDRERVSRLFALLSSVKVGSAEYVIERIKNSWARYDKHKENEKLNAVADDGEDKEEDEELDIVSY